MISIYKIEEKKVSPDENFKTGDERVSVEIRGLSTDEMPTSIGTKLVDNGSIYVAIDTGDVYIYDLKNEEWHQV